ncbi:MAG: stage II sporulation protein R [Clostridiales bacterium GWE2_32_10]|nr:MAG: stage II sporulation protein R [Clostridiales bacterium GWE2_32_10]
MLKINLRKERNIILMALVIGFIITCTYVTYATTFEMKSLQEDLASRIIRFHCIANSDSKEDQTLKLKVRDEILSSMRDELSNAKDINETRKIILANIDKIQKIAESVIKREGKDYKVEVKLEKNVSFPIKNYGDITVPAGKYEALRVIIGEGAGKNWWCVMFPPLCFVDESYAVVDTKTNQKLKKVLTDDEYKMITQNRKVNIKFRLLEK